MSDTPEENSETLDDQTVPELKETAKEEGLTGYSSLNKGDLIDAIDDSRDREPDPDPEGEGHPQFQGALPESESPPTEPATAPEPEQSPEPEATEPEPEAPSIERKSIDERRAAGEEFGGLDKHDPLLGWTAQKRRVKSDKE